MKRIFSILIASALCLTMAACGSGAPAETAMPEFIMTEPTVTENQVPETAAPEAVELAITLENWETYFELNQASEPRYDAEGQIEGWDFFCGVFLKPQYAERFVSGQVDFEIQFVTEHREAFQEDGDCTLGDPVGESLESDFQQKTFALEDFRNREDLPALSDFAGTVAGQVYCGSTRQAENGSFLADVPADGRILHAEGSLTLIP